MRVSALALLPLLLACGACGQPGASPEMRDNDGEANAPSTVVPDQAPPADRAGETSEGADDDGPAARNQEGDQEIGRSPDIISEETRARMGSDEGMQAVLADPRRAEASARDEARHPAQTLAFFGIEPDMTVVEVWPGGGWYADILAPYLAQGGGTYVAAGFDPAMNDYMRERVAAFEEKYVGKDEYGDVQMAVLSPDSGPIVEEGTADMVLTFRNVHNWVMGDFGEKAFADFYAALKPGGVLGVVEHRLPEEAGAEMEETSGYVKESTVIALAEAAGFELAERSEVNANPADDADHPFGVWTLPPTSRTQDRDGNAPEGFDADEYAGIGESDRMTLRFVKPLGADGALLE